MNGRISEQLTPGQSSPAITRFRLTQFQMLLRTGQQLSYARRKTFRQNEVSTPGHMLPCEKHEYLNQVNEK